MTIAHIEPVPTSLLGLPRFLGRLRTAVAAMARARQRRQAFAQLHAMSERELKDLGIGRSEVTHWRDAA